MVDDAPRPEHSPSPTPREHSIERLLSLLELEERGNGELSWQIAEFLGWSKYWNSVTIYLPPGATEEDGPWHDKPPAYTTSLDAALTLTDGRCVALSIDTAPGDGYPAHASVGRIHFGHAQTMPLALVIAALRARAAK